MLTAADDKVESLVKEMLVLLENFGSRFESEKEKTKKAAVTNTIKETASTTLFFTPLSMAFFEVGSFYIFCK